MTPEQADIAFARNGIIIHAAGTVTAAQAKCSHFTSITSIGDEALVIDSFDGKANIYKLDGGNHVPATGVTLPLGGCIIGRFHSITTSAGEASLGRGPTTI